MEYENRPLLKFKMHPRKSAEKKYQIILLINYSVDLITSNVTTADCRDDKDIKKQFRRQNAVGNMLVRKFSFAPIESKIQLFSHFVTLFMDVLFGAIHTRTLLENLRSVIVTHSSVLLTSPDTPARVWHLR